MAVLTGFALLATVPIALAADASGSAPQADASRAAGPLDASVSATLELYAFETELRRAQVDLETFAARRTIVARERAAVQRQLGIAREAVRSSQSQLGALVRALYEQPGQSDPLVVLLSADSLDGALAAFEGLNRAADENSRIIEQARTTRTRLAALDAELVKKAGELAALAAAAEQRVRDLAATAAARRSYVAALQHQQDLDAARVAAIEAEAKTAEKQTLAISSSAQPVASAVAETAGPAAIAMRGPRTITVTSTGYSLHGRTSTGMQTGRGVIAVDPAVIPLGTRLTIPGYGTGIAADTGGAVRGNVIDLWFPTAEQALAWGRRTVTITIP